MRFTLLCLLVGLAAPEAFAQRIAIAPFTGPGANALRNQVVSALCDQAECVSEKKVTAGGKPDWKKAKKEKVKFIVTGKVTAKGKKKTVDLEVMQKAGPAKFKKSWPLEGAELSATAQGFQPAVPQARVRSPCAAHSAPSTRAPPSGG